MTIIDYDENTETLSVKFSTSTVWKYKYVDKKFFEDIKKAPNPEDLIKNRLHKSFTVGTYKKGN